jgi:integrase
VLASPAPATEDAITTGEWLRQWLSVREQNWAEQTTTSRRGTVKRWLEPALGHVPLAELTRETIEKALHAMKAPGRHGKPQAPPAYTRRRAFEILSTSLNDAVKYGRITHNPCQEALVAKTRSEDINPLTETEQQQFLAAIEGEPDEHRWRVSLQLGLRQSEVLGLCWEDIDWGQQAVHVAWQLSRNTHLPDRRVRLKTRASRRVLPIPNTLLPVLRRAWEEQGRPSQGWVVLGRFGGPKSASGERRRFGVLCEKAGITRHVRIHDLRHTCATNLLAHGTPDRVTQAIMGWSSIVMAQRYQHPVLPMLRAALDAA